MTCGMTAGSLFAGAGGIDIGFQDAGFQVEWSNELDRHACATLKANFKHDIIHRDIRNFHDPKRVDVVMAGFPCQAFSVAGYRNGFKDPRGKIFFETVRIIRKAKPAAIMLENVRNLETHNRGRTLEKILAEIGEAGYKTKHKVLNTRDYSELPQNRERLYIVGFRSGKAKDRFEFPPPVGKTRNIREVLEKDVDDRFYYDDFPHLATLKREITKEDTCYQWRRRYVRENKSGVCPTLTANMGAGGHNVPLILDGGRIRKLTPRECFRFQGFNDKFILLPPPIIRIPTIQAGWQQRQRSRRPENCRQHSQGTSMTKKWEINLTGLEGGIFRTMHGNADEMIAIGRVIKAGFPCSRVDVTNAKYDAVVDMGGRKKMLRIQIKGTSTGSLNFVGGPRSGKQIDKNAPSRSYKYTEDDCDLIIGVDSTNGDCYIIPIADISKWGKNKSLSQLSDYKEAWSKLIELVG